MAPTYPKSLTTSDWVDALVGLSRADQIAVLATFHRRVEHAAKLDALNALANPHPDADDVVTAAVTKAIAALPPPADYA